MKIFCLYQNSFNIYYYGISIIIDILQLEITTIILAQRLYHIIILLFQ